MATATAPKIKTTSAGLADQIAEKVRDLVHSDSPTREVLAAMLTEAESADEARREAIEKELADAERAVEEDPYTKKLARRQDARAAARVLSCAPTPLSGRVKARLSITLPASWQDAIEHFKTDLIHAYDAARNIDVAHRPKTAAAVRKRLAELGEALRALNELRFALDVPKEIAAWREKLGVKESPRVMVGPRPEIVYED